jgi:hypothetical protein
MSKACKIPTDQQKILNAFKRTLLELQDDPDERAKLAQEYDPSDKCGCSGNSER